MNLELSEDFVNTLENNKGIIYKIANSYCKDPEDRQDLIQEITIQLWKSFERYNGTAKFSTWMYKISLNTAISFYRKNNRRKVFHVPLSKTVIQTTSEVLEDEKEVSLGLLEKFIRELNELDRALIILYLEEKSQHEIAEILGISISNVSTKIGRIKERLKNKFSRLNDN
jgi:RNA polymerase sigma factor (sigma-70 family)